jgi:hypothetical protein
MATKKTAAVQVEKPADIRTFSSWKSVLLVKAKSGLGYGVKIHVDGGTFKVKDKSGNVLYTGGLIEFAKQQFKNLGFMVAE